MKEKRDMNMKTSKLFVKFIPLIFIAIFLNACSESVYEAAWQSVPVKADGNSREWPNPLKYYDRTTKLLYTVSNDLENLYVCVRSGEEPMQMKILRSGIQLW